MATEHTALQAYALSSYMYTPSWCNTCGCVSGREGPETNERTSWCNTCCAADTGPEVGVLPGWQMNVNVNVLRCRCAFSDETCREMAFVSKAGPPRSRSRATYVG